MTGAGESHFVVVSEQGVDVSLKGDGGCAMYHIVDLASQPPPARTTQATPSQTCVKVRMFSGLV